MVNVSQVTMNNDVKTKDRCLFRALVSSLLQGTWTDNGVIILVAEYMASEEFVLLKGYTWNINIFATET